MADGRRRRAGAGGQDGAEARLETVLGEISGAGRVSVLYSDEGVAVVCEGASSARCAWTS